MAVGTRPGTLPGMILLLALLISFRTAAAESDTRAPSVAVSTDSCRTTVTAVFTDTLTEDSGIDRITVREHLNCSVSLDTSLSPALVTAQITLSDPLLDAVYALEAIDRQGNARYIRDTLQGFTLRFFPARDSTVWPGVIPTQAACEPVQVYNAGLLPCTITEAFCARNTVFSVPPSQFPLTLAPGDSAVLTVCFTPPADSAWRDTLVAWMYCRSLALPLYGRGVTPPVDHIADTRCGAPVRLRSTETVLQHPVLYPNPANERSVLRFGLPDRSSVTVRLVNVTGAVLLYFRPTAYAPGVYELELDLSQPEAGLYFCEVLVGTTRTVLPVQIVH